MKQNKDKSFMITFRIDKELYKKLSKYLYDTGMTRTNFIKRLIIKYFDKNKSVK
ncbi:hypothetical protein [Flavobacterium filum]|uniref:hypothetical protein n=1 Tax=Flavobacterium filum TaxID=370974 RepID=UPI0023EF5CE4|nr:hypothetical protein [Flavobacterium filum]